MNLFKLYFENDIRLIILHFATIIFYLLLSYSILKHFVNINRDKLFDSFSELVNHKPKVNYKKYAKDDGINIKMSFIETMDLRFIERTNIKAYIPFLSIYLVLFLIGVLFILSFIYTYNVFNMIIVSLILCTIISSVPLVILQIIGQVVSQKAKQELHNYITIMHSWANVKTDIIYVFEKTATSTTAIKLNSPLYKYTEQMVSQIKKGLEPTIAMRILKMKINNKQFDNFIMNIEEAYKSQGDLLRLLTKLKSQAYALEHAYDNRKMKTLFERNIALGFSVFTGFLIVFLFKTNENIRQIFLDTKMGNIAFIVAIMSYSIGCIWQLKTIKFKH